MDFVTTNLLPMIYVTLGAVFIALFVSVLGYFIYRINTTDYSDQSGWRNFSKPFLGVSLVIIAIQAIVAGVFVIYYYFSRQN